MSSSASKRMVSADASADTIIDTADGVEHVELDSRDHDPDHDPDHVVEDVQTARDMALVAIRRREKRVHFTLFVIYLVGVIINMAGFSKAWVRLRENSASPEDPTSTDGDKDMVFHNVYVSSAGVPVPLSLFTLGMLISGAIYNGLCAKAPPEPGRWWIPWTWRNEVEFWADYKRERNAAMWDEQAWSGAVSAVLVAILCQLHDEWQLVCIGVLSACYAFNAAYTEGSNRRSPAAISEFWSAAWKALVPFVTRIVLLARQYYLMLHATPVPGSKPFVYPVWIKAAAMLEMLPSIVQCLLLWLRAYSLLGMDKYDRYHNVNRFFIVFGRLSVPLVVHYGLATM